MTPFFGYLDMRAVLKTFAALPLAKQINSNATIATTIATTTTNTNFDSSKQNVAKRFSFFIFLIKKKMDDISNFFVSFFANQSEFDGSTSLAGSIVAHRNATTS